jgi:hypothetical protein
MYSKKISISLLSLLLLLSLTFNASAKTFSSQRYRASQIISHSIPLDVVFLGYDQGVIDISALDSVITQDYTVPYVEWLFNYHFDVNYVFANQTYLQTLTFFILQNSVAGMNTTSKLNVTALEYQKATATKMSVFLPQSGRAIDAMAVEDWFAANPYVSSSMPRYTFYVLNFTMFDSPDHSLEHWYNLTEPDFDANTTRDFWRLEWDNPLNPHVDFPYAAFSHRHSLFFIDPSAFNWYLTWARIWWELDPYITDPKYDYYFEDLDTFQRTHDLNTPEGKTALGYYLGGWIDDILSNTLASAVWVQPTYSQSLQILVLNNASEYGYTNDKMRWMINTSLVKEAVEQMVPWIPTDVSVKFANLSEYPDINALLQNCIINKTNGWTYIDGMTFFYGLEDLRYQHFNYNKAEMVVNGYVTLLKNASMIVDSGEFTGLGGDRQVLLMKSIDRYFRADGVTPKSGLTSYMTHELGHNLGFGHTFGWNTYASDFAFDVMGYYPYSYRFTKLLTDAYRRTYADMTLAELQNALAVDQELYSHWNSSSLIDALFDEIGNRITEASPLYDELEYLDVLYKLFEAQRIEAYLREILTDVIPFGDINHDGIVNITDAARVGAAWRSHKGEPEYDFYADLNHNGIINIQDGAQIGANWLKTGKTKAGFFRWATGNRTTTFDYIASIYPDWTTIEKNVTYGYWNWDSASLQCSLRIKDITDPDNLVNFYVKIYNATTTVLEVTWNSGDPLPQDWASFTVTAHSKYSIHVEFTGTSYAPTWWSRVTIETRVDTP